MAERDNVFGALADPALLVRLDLKPGERITVGAATFEIRAALRNEPDKLAGGIGFGPRLLISEAAIARDRPRAARQSRALALSRETARQRCERPRRRRRSSPTREKQLPEAGWEIRTRSNASPALERNVERFTQFLTLVGLTALLVGGVGVANAVKSHLDRKRDTIAAMKSLGATGARVFVIYLTQVLSLAAIGAVIGLVLGAALPFAISSAVRKSHSAADRARIASRAARARLALRT